MASNLIFRASFISATKLNAENASDDEAEDPSQMYSNAHGKAS